MTDARPEAPRLTPKLEALLRSAAELNQDVRILLAEVDALRAALATQRSHIDALILQVGDAESERYAADAALTEAQEKLSELNRLLGKVGLERDSAREQFDRHVAWASERAAEAEQRIARLETALREAVSLMQEGLITGIGAHGDILGCEISRHDIARWQAALAASPTGTPREDK